MSLMLPVHGQEMLAFRWKGQGKKLAGQFAGRAVQAFQSSKNSAENSREAALLKKVWPEFEKTLAFFFASLRNPSQYCENSDGPSFSCRSKTGQVVDWMMSENDVQFHSLLSEQVQLEIRLLDKQEDGLRRFEIFIFELPKARQSRPTLGLELFAESCKLL